LQGLDVELISFRGDAEVAQALAGNSIDLSLQSLDGLINLINAGQPVRGFYAGFFQSDFAWLAQPRIKQWKDLKGGTAGVSTYGSLTDQLTRYILKRNGLEPEKDVQLVQVGTTASMLQALKAGRLALARAEAAMTVDILIERLKWSKQYAQRAYEEVMPAYDERGRLPDAHMNVFWAIEIAG